MSQQFLNTELKSYNALTREEKHIILDAALDSICEVYDDYSGRWVAKDGIVLGKSSIYRTKPKEYKKLDIPWKYISDYWKYAAMDGDGSVLLYDTKPEWMVEHNIWSCNQNYHNLGVLKLDTTGIIAEHSLTQRPEGA